MRDFLRSPLARVWVPVLGLTAVVAYLDRGADTGDLIYFVHRGEELLSPAWADTFSDESLQAGPLLLAIVGVLDNFTLLAFVIELGVAALLLYVFGRLGASDRVRLCIGLLAVISGLTHGAFVDGHPAQAFVPLLWVLGAIWAREDRAVAAGALVGVSAGLELWGVLGAVVLLLAPSLRRTIAGVVAEGAVVCAMLAPFVLAGTFRMFEYEWSVATGTLISLFVEPGTDFGWPLRLLQASFAVCAGGAVALALRRNLHAVWLAPLGLVCVRLLLDPLAYGWYWLAALALVLVGAALVLGSLPRRVFGAVAPRYPSVEK
jgi:hypothetical protein